jgi:hypothetical protein
MSSPKPVPTGDPRPSRRRRPCTSCCTSPSRRRQSHRSTISQCILCRCCCCGCCCCCHVPLTSLPAGRRDRGLIPVNATAERSALRLISSYSRLPSHRHCCCCCCCSLSPTTADHQVEQAAPSFPRSGGRARRRRRSTIPLRQLRVPDGATRPRLSAPGSRRRSFGSRRRRCLGSSARCPGLTRGAPAADVRSLGKWELVRTSDASSSLSAAAASVCRR